MGEFFSRATEKLVVVSKAVLNLPSQNSIDTLRNEVAQKTAQIGDILNPSPLAHAMGETAEAVDDFVGRNVSQGTVKKVVEWKEKYVKQGIQAAKDLLKKLGDLDLALLSVRDRYLIRIMEVKAGNYIPEPIQNIIF